MSRVDPIARERAREDERKKSDRRSDVRYNGGRSTATTTQSTAATTQSSAQAVSSGGAPTYPVRTPAILRPVAPLLAPLLPRTVSGLVTSRALRGLARSRTPLGPRRPPWASNVPAGQRLAPLLPVVPTARPGDPPPQPKRPSLLDLLSVPYRERPPQVTDWKRVTRHFGRRNARELRRYMKVLDPPPTRRERRQWAKIDRFLERELGIVDRRSYEQRQVDAAKLVEEQVGRELTLEDFVGSGIERPETRRDEATMAVLRWGIRATADTWNFMQGGDQQAARYQVNNRGLMGWYRSDWTDDRWRVIAGADYVLRGDYLKDALAYDNSMYRVGTPDLLHTPWPGRADSVRRSVAGFVDRHVTPRTSKYGNPLIIGAAGVSIAAAADDRRLGKTSTREYGEALIGGGLTIGGQFQPLLEFPGFAWDTWSLARQAGSEQAGRAGGGRVRGGETTLVGERGPEIVRLPPGSDVVPAHRSRALMETAPASSPSRVGDRALELHQYLDGREVARSTVRNIDDDEQWGWR